ncbi:MAG: efflux RND transporter permease subunit [Cellvibrionaceae bacterium]|nr:efflux RND transporter permease subunit [Cellvibrionaceae bacterium]
MDSVSYFINNKLVGWIFIVLSLFFGTVAYFNSPRFEDPEFIIRTAQIITQYPGATVQQVAEEISDEIETELQAMQEVDEVRSTSYPGMSIISVDIKNSFSSNREQLNLIWTRLRDRIADTQSRLPPGATASVVHDDWGDVFGLYYMATGDGFTLKEIYDYTQELRKGLLAVPNVAKVEIIGNQEEVIAVEISRGRVAALGLSMNSVIEALSQQNTIVASGDLKLGDQRIRVQPTGEIDSLAEIRNLAISFNNGEDVIKLADIANIAREDIAPAKMHARFNGKPAIAFGISAVTGANVAEVGRGVRKVLAETLPNQPVGLEINEFYHQGDVVDKSVTDFAFNVLLALVIVLATLWIFMGLRAAIVIGSVLIITIAATLATMYAVSIPLHRISLGALIIALGMLVDNAIVVVDGILEGKRRGQSLITAASSIVRQTKWPLLGGTLVGIIAFAPIGLAPGNVAEYCRHLFWVIFISLCFSWLFAISLAPMLADSIMTGESKSAGESRAMALYKRFLRHAIQVRWLAMTVTAVLFLAALWGFQFVKVGFFPTSTTPQIAIDYWLPEGSDISATTRDIKRIEQSVMDLENVASVHSVVGQPALRYMLIYAPELPNAAFGQIILKIDDFSKISLLVDRIQQHIDQNFPAAQARVWRFRLGPGQGSKIEASFSGPDPATLRRIAAEAENILRSTPSAVAVKSDWRQMVPMYQPVYDPSRGSRLGVGREDFVHSINQNLSGKTIGFLREGTDLLRIISRSPERERRDIAALSNAQVSSAINGRTVPLSEAYSSVELTWDNGLMLREDRQWTLKVQADPARGFLASEVLQQVQAKIEAIALPAGYRLEWQGEYGDSKDANGELALTLPLGLLAMVLVVILMFNALRQAAVIWLIVPLAIIGVVLGFLVTGTAMEFMGILGMLSLSGLLIKNALVMVEQMDAEIRDGTPRLDAVIASAASRVRPIMMGALTTALGVLPLIEDVFFASMAVALAFGLICATLLTLIVLPILYTILFGIKNAETASEGKLKTDRQFNLELIEARP